tara:strand:+ start:6653 stop:8962 length:2310 start_codon:yes stop_codon:yes gene_type:complete
MHLPLSKRYIHTLKSKLIFGLALGIFLSSCGTARHLKEDEKLLTNVKIKFEGKSKYSDDLYSLSKQKPNRKFLGIFSIYLGIYNLFYYKENSKLRNNLGEAPVIFDSSSCGLSTGLMTRYLNNRGYYKNNVTYQTKSSKKRVKLIYKVKKNKRFFISKVSHDISDSTIAELYLNDSVQKHLEAGMPFDLEELKKERQQTDYLLKNNGYYRFFEDYVVYQVDTFMDRNEAEVTLMIKNPKRKIDAAVSKNKHQVYTIKDVIVRTDYNSNETNVAGDTLDFNNITFIDYQYDKVNKRLLSKIIHLKPGEIYRIKNQDNTYRNLSELRLFNSINIVFEEVKGSETNELIAYIDLNPRKKRSFSVETEGTNNGGNLGVNGTLKYQNINTFRGGELFNLGVNGGLEAQRILTDDDESGQIAGGALGFNTFEFGPSASLEIPRFLFPIKTDALSLFNPRTSFNASFNYQERPDYVRNITKTYIAYTWNSSPTVSHIVQPFDLSYAKISLSPAFERLLREIQNPFLTNTYTDNLIMALKYSFILNTQGSNKLRNHQFIRVNLESSGNLLSAITDGFNDSQNEDGSYNFLNIRYAQYFKSDFDYRYYQKLNNNEMVYRLAVGIGLPYGNSVAMPFEKSFYAGGANNNRAWRARELGPGTLSDSIRQNVDQIGNFKIELNLEYRFPISKLFESAVFIDAGNIWNVRQDEDRFETQFAIDRLWDGLAIGIGTGIRLNFTFFILRLDVAAPFKDPGSIDPTQLKLKLNETNLNLGIGYPF